MISSLLNLPPTLTFLLHPINPSSFLYQFKFNSFKLNLKPGCKLQRPVHQQQVAGREQ
jgi:hypothetical protein